MEEGGGRVSQKLTLTNRGGGPQITISRLTLLMDSPLSEEQSSVFQIHQVLVIYWNVPNIKMIL